MSQPTLAQFAELSDDLLSTAGSDGRFTWVSPSWTRTLGWSAEELTTRPFMDFVHPDDVARTLAEAGRLMGPEARADRFRNRYRTRDGGYRWLEWNSRVSEGGLMFSVARDVTEAVEQEHRREDLVQKLQLAESLGGVGHWTYDLTAGRVDWSPGIYRITEVDPDEGVPDLEQVIQGYHPDDREVVSAEIHKALDGGTFAFERRYVRPSGEERTFRVAGQALRAPTGEVNGVLGVAVDITDQVQIAAEAAEARALLDLFLREAPITLWRLGPDERFVAFRGAGLTRFGMEPDGLIGVGLGKLFADRPDIVDGVREVLSGGGPFRYDSQGVSANGQPYHFTTVAVPDPQHAGHAVGLSFDKTELWLAHRDAERQRARAEDLRRRYEIVFDATEAGLFEWDLVAGAVTWSARLERMLDVSPAARRSAEEWSERLHPDDREHVLAAVRAHVEEGRPYAVVARLRTGDDRRGPWVWHRSTGQALRDASGEPKALIGSTVDITEERRAMQALERAAAEARAASEAKSRFIANISHEIRTPLNAILGLAELVRTSEGLAPEHAAHLEDMTHASHVLLRLIGDVLDLAKAEAGALDLDREAFSPRRLLEEQLQLFRGVAEGKGLALRSQLEGVPDDLVLDGDRQRIAQVVGNLLGNALKFTRAGEVVLSARIRSVGAADRVLAFEISDTGPGIPEPQRETIFGAFEQVDGSVARAHGGTGLGLAISRGLVERMGGSITVDARLGGGSVFAVRLPLPQAAGSAWTEATVSADGEEVPDGLRVLVVEDNAVNRKVATLMLERLGCVVSCAAEGRVGVDKALAGDVDVVFMDVQMPGLDGLAATRRIREREGTDARLPIIGLTAHASPEDRERCMQAGMDDRVTKPVSIEALRAALVAAWARRSSQGAGARREIATSGSRAAP